MSLFSQKKSKRKTNAGFLGYRKALDEAISKNSSTFKYNNKTYKRSKMKIGGRPVYRLAGRSKKAKRSRTRRKSRKN
jgi:hypothetical protein